MFMFTTIVYSPSQSRFFVVQTAGVVPRARARMNRAVIKHAHLYHLASATTGSRARPFTL